ncbi:MAG: hypothetical protein IJ781_04620 [Atopobiaceae bacterium]|nr:hypothetical protein [Atopobiaceae bacterium]
MAKHTTASRSSVGNKREVAPGKWIVRVSDGYKRDGKQQRRLSRTVYGTERDADLAIAELTTDLGRIPDLGDGCTLREYWDNIYHPRILARSDMRDGRTGKRKMAKGTLKRYEAAWRRRIEPTFGDWELADIRHAAVQAWAYRMPRSEAEHSVRVLRTILREAWSYDELLSSQPLPRAIDLPGDVPEQARVWTPSELMRAMPLLRDTPVESIWLVMAGGGLRREEAYALWWHDLRFETVTSIHLSDDATTSRDECLCSVPVDDAYTVDDGRKDVKTARGRRVATIGEPFSSRLREMAAEHDGDEPLCPLSITRVPYAWALLWGEPLKRNGGKGKFYRGRMRDPETGEDILPRVELRTMRHAHECMMAGYLTDSDNSLMHGHSREVSYDHYRRMDETRTAQAALKAGRALAAI